MGRDDDIHVRNQPWPFSIADSRAKENDQLEGERLWQRRISGEA